MLTLFFLLYGGIHAYAFVKAQAALGLGFAAGVPLAAWMALMTFTPMIIWRLERRGRHVLVRIGSLVGYTWMGFVFLFFWIALALDLVGWLVPAVRAALDWKPADPGFDGARTFYAAIALATAATAYGWIEARIIRVERVRLRTTRLPLSVGRLRIAQISDVHLGALVGARRLRRILARVQALAPDILVSTGDLVDGQADHLNGLARLFEEIRPRFGKFAVTGNHEFYVGVKRALDFTKRAGFTVLRGEAVTVAGAISVAGVDDPAGRAMGVEVHVDEKEILAALPRERFTLLLKHQPVIGRDCAGLFDLQLSGHTHKGQIFPFGLFVRMAYPVRTGLTALASRSHLYVSRGTGTWGPPMRLFAPPEVTLIEIEAAGPPDEAKG